MSSADRYNDRLGRPDVPPQLHHMLVQVRRLLLHPSPGCCPRSRRLIRMLSLSAAAALRARGGEAGGHGLEPLSGQPGAQPRAVPGHLLRHVVVVVVGPRSSLRRQTVRRPPAGVRDERGGRERSREQGGGGGGGTEPWGAGGGGLVQPAAAALLISMGGEGRRSKRGLGRE